MNNISPQVPQDPIAFTTGYAIAPTSNEIDLRELFSAVWAGKWLIMAVTFVFAIASVVIALMLPNIYKSEALLAPANVEQQGGIGALASQFGGLASMAGLNLGGGSSIDKTQLAISVLKSRQFTSNFIKDHDILPQLMAAESWNQSDDSLAYDKSLYDSSKQLWVREVEAPKQPKPSPQEAYKTFSEIIEVQVDKDTGLVRISIEHLSPTIAQQWVTWLIEDINAEMKKREVSEAIKSTEFLEKQISETNVADIRTVLYQLIEEQTKTIMFAEVRDEYVFKTIDPAIVAEEKFKPKRALVCIVGTLFGGFLASLFVLIRFFLRKAD
ncbi:Wzz/FepE/Etk N-terminal domain-containing protein [Shewanella psychrotolerans]|uniref:Wzz/FepE/Etk N-terminal domain-containing protein n=1 Tax=Shewanella psychrotolerans TaxID=2864206 RepID=UPI001C6579C1|nr:Wzz/FepE/Etk N-terminal domain-containing protein [Shewanella psychrotolerans]QYK00277.1 LPS O-antigen length regulator [Shewanella psychrotolerans]